MTLVHVDLAKSTNTATERNAMEHPKVQQNNEAVRWMEQASQVAGKALCLKAKCGTVIVKDGEVVGEGYNAPALDKEENRMCGKEFGVGKPKYDKTCCMHAEWRAIMDALRRNPEHLQGAQLYFVRIDDQGNIKMSGKPYCTTCSRLALDVGIATFALWHEEGIVEYPTDEYNERSYQYVHKALE